MKELSESYWTERYTNRQIGWDLGAVSPPIKAYIDQLTNKELSILIPGCGNGYEGQYLFELGFKNVSVLDFSSLPLSELSKRSPDFPKENLIQTNFFKHSGQYDIIIEQTLFCAIDPSLRGKYIDQMNKLLAPQGKLVGLLFNRQFEGGPPFGGNKEVYLTQFKNVFTNVYMEDCYNSIEPRRGSELFIKIQKD